MTTTRRPKAVIVRRRAPDPSAIAAPGPYVEAVWTPLVGGVAVAALRALQRLAAAAPGEEVAIDELAVTIGERGPGAAERTWTAIERLDADGAVAWLADEEVLEVPAAVRVLDGEQLARVPPPIRALHAAWALGRPDGEASSVADGAEAVIALLDELLDDGEVSPLRAVARWDEVARLAARAHDDLVASLAVNGSRAPSQVLADAGRDLAAAVRSAQRSLVIDHAMSEADRARLRAASSAVLACLEPPGSGTSGGAEGAEP